MKKRARLVGLNVLFVVLILFLIEVGFRISVPDIQFSGTEKTLIRNDVYDETSGLTPNSEGLSNGVLKKVDKNGFWKYRDTSNSQKKILFLGDSVTMGIGVESDSTFAGRINNETDFVSVINPSLIGYTSSDYLNVIHSLIIENQNLFDIDAVYLFWCLNDVYDNNFSTIGFNSSGIKDRMVSLLRNHSKLFHFLKANFTDRSKAYFLHDAKFYSSTDPNFQAAIANLDEIDSLLSSKQILFEVIILPYEYQLRKESDSSTLQPNSKLKNALSERNISYLDVISELFLEDFPSKKLYLYGDGIHFSSFGHRVIAHEVSNKTFNLVP